MTKTTILLDGRRQRILPTAEKVKAILRRMARDEAEAKEGGS